MLKFTLNQTITNLTLICMSQRWTLITEKTKLLKNFTNQKNITSKWNLQTPISLQNLTLFLKLIKCQSLIKFKTTSLVKFGIIKITFLTQIKSIFDLICFQQSLIKAILRMWFWIKFIMELLARSLVLLLINYMKLLSLLIIVSGTIWPSLFSFSQILGKRSLLTFWI